LVNAADYGVPQKRERVFIVGFRSDIDAKWTFPETTHSEESLLWDKWVTGEYWKRHNIPEPSIDERTEKKVAKLIQKYGFFRPAQKPWLTVRDAIADLPEPSSPEALNFNQHIFKDGARVYPG
ncbi:DNA cytosine methyltransferase, partial [Vibrio cholerae]